MGTWQAAKRMWVGIEDADSIKTIRAAYEAGITTIDIVPIEETMKALNLLK